jgi:hypothetical protein
VSGFHKTNSLTLAWCAIVVGSLTACGISDLTAGNPFPGSPSHMPCSTGTQVALADPLPGAVVAATKRPIKIVSNLTISNAKAALALKTSRGFMTPPRPLIGPIPKPKNAPTPFPSPLYYEARGFALQSSTMYAVEVASIGSNCRPKPISGAIFKTKR